MNFTEQKNYIIAVVVSLIFHFLILTIHLPGILALKNPEIDTFPVGIVEIASGSFKGASVSLPKNQPNISAELNNQDASQSTKKRHQIHSDIKSNQSPKNTTTLTNKNGMVIAEKSTKNISSKIIPSENLAAKKSIVNPDHPSKDINTTHKKEEAVSDNSVRNSENKSVSSGDIKEISGSKNFGTGEPKDLGTGEEMVTVFGPMPIYPPKAMKEGKEGNVTVRVLVNDNGSLDLAIITNSSGDLHLDYAAISSLKRNWKFKPITKGYYIDLIFSFNVRIGVSVKFLNSKTRL